MNLSVVLSNFLLKSTTISTQAPIQCLFICGFSNIILPITKNLQTYRRMNKDFWCIKRSNYSKRRAKKIL